ncbi:hypothetical protein AAMO2058_001614800 [Amorphochlora amoebiformis]
MRVFRRLVLAAGSATVGAYGMALYVNDDFDDLSANFKLFKGRGKGGEEKMRLVVLGSGWGSMSLIRKLDLDTVDLTVISPRPYFFYTPLLAGSATGTVSQENICESVRKSIVRVPTGGIPQGGRYIQARAIDVDMKNKSVLCSVGSESQDMSVPYDKLVVAVGADSATYGIKGVKENAYPLKEVEHAVAIRSKLLSLFERASSLKTLTEHNKKPTQIDTEIDRLVHFVVVGGGPTGTELCGELSDFIQSDIANSFPDIAKRVKITMLEGLPRILSMFDENLASYAQSHLEERNVNIVTNVFVTDVGKTEAKLKTRDGKQNSISYGMLVWAAGITTRQLTRDLIKKIGPHKGQTSRRGLVVDESLRVVGCEDIYAIGDCAVSGLPPTAQVAQQQGKWLGRVLRQITTDAAQPDSSFRFSYHDKGKMAYIGGSEGIVEVKLPKNPPKIDYEFWRDLHAREPRFTGTPGFVVWRSVYFSMLLSARNRVYIGMDWLRTAFFGRDIVASPQPKRKNT